MLFCLYLHMQCAVVQGYFQHAQVPLCGLINDMIAVMLLLHQTGWNTILCCTCGGSYHVQSSTYSVLTWLLGCLPVCESFSRSWQPSFSCVLTSPLRLGAPCCCPRPSTHSIWRYIFNMDSVLLRFGSLSAAACESQ